MSARAKTAYLLASGRRIAPFDWEVSETPLHNAPLRERQEHALRRAGCRVVRIEKLSQATAFPCLLAFDDVFFTPAAVRGFLSAAARRRDSDGGPAAYRAALETGPLTERLAPALQGELDERHETPLRLYDLFYLTGPLKQRPESAIPLPIRFRATRIGGRTHTRFDPSGRFDIPVSLVYLSPVRHWADVVVCNVMGLAAHLYETARRRPLATLLMPLAAAGRAASLRPTSLQSKLYFRGRKARIHPSAHLEGVVVGPRARIGPNAVLRFCSVGSRAVIGAGAVVDACNIGDRATINPQVVLRGAVVGEDAMVGAYFTQMSAIGHRAVMCPDSGILDFNLRGQVPVQLDGETVRLGSSLMGGAVGDDAFLGPKVSLSFGCEVPNGCVLVRSPRHFVRSVAADKLPDNVVRMDRGRRRAA